MHAPHQAGKTGYIAQLMKNRGQIVASDRDPERLRVLESNVMQLGNQIVQSFRHDWTRGRIPKGIASIGPIRSYSRGCAVHEYRSNATARGRAMAAEAKRFHPNAKAAA